MDTVIKLTESQELDLFLEEFLQESNYSDISSRIRKLAEDLKNGNADKDDIKDLYEDIKSLPTGDQAKAAFALALALISFISWVVAAVTVKIVPVATISVVIAILSSILVSPVLDKADKDTIYNKLMKEEAVAMKNLRIAKESNDKEAIKINEKIIELCEELKKKRREVLNSKAYGTTIKESVDVLQEYKGNEIKSNIFIQVLTDMDNLIKFYIERIAIYDENVDKMFNLAKKSTKQTLSKNYMEMVKLGRDMNDDIATAKDNYAPMTWNQLTSQLKKFNNKYSELSMTQREALDNKMQSYLKDVQKYLNKYDSKDKFKEERDILDKCRAIDGGTTNQISELIYSWVQLLWNELIATKRDILDIINMLNIDGIKGSLLYNILNKSSKSKIR